MITSNTPALLLLLISNLSFALNGFAESVMNESMNTSQSFRFEENKGQIRGADAEKVSFFINTNRLNIFVFEDRLVYQHHKPLENKTKKSESPRKEMHFEKNPLDSEKLEFETFRIDLALINSNPNPFIIPSDPLSSYKNYYAYDALNVASYAVITLKNVYENIDWVIRGTDSGIKHEFLVHPGGNPSDIQLKINWAENFLINENGDFVLHNRLGSIIEKQPISFQKNTEIQTSFMLSGDTLSYTLAHYDPNQTLIIDPEIAWSTYYGGQEEEYGKDCKADALGNVYLCGHSYSTLFIAPGGHQTNLLGVINAFLTKFDSDGNLLWATFYGGSPNGGGTNGLGIGIDNQNNVYLTGNTSDASNIAYNGFKNFLLGYIDAFLVKFNPSGERIWATYYGGSGFDFGESCTIDNDGNVFLVGTTYSSNMISHNGFQNEFGDIMDAYLVKFNSNGNRLWATYYGGKGHDHGNSCAVDQDGNVFLLGTTNSGLNNLGQMAQDGHQVQYGGQTDAFLAKFSSNGNRLWATYYGGNQYDTGNSCAVDNQGNVYITGGTGSSNHIVSPNYANTIVGGYNAYVAKFAPNGTRFWGRLIGGNNDDYGQACSVDLEGNIFLGMTTSSEIFAYPELTNTYSGGEYDGLLVKLNTNGQLTWMAYYGGEEIDEVFGNAISPDGSVLYVCGTTKSTSGIALNAHQGSLSGYDYEDAFLAKFVNSSVCQLQVLLEASDTLICRLGSVSFNTQIIFAGDTTNYQWFKNGNPIGGNHPYYIADDVNDGDFFYVQVSSNNPCALIQSITSDTITITVLNTDVPEFPTFGPYCSGSQAFDLPTVSNNGIPGNWQPETNMIETTIYTFAPHSSTCKNYIDTIVILPSPAVTLEFNGNELIATSGFVSYSWSLNTTTLPFVGNAIPVTMPGLYSVLASNEYACENIANYDLTSLNTPTNTPNFFSLYPNPSTGHVNIIMDSMNPAILEIYDYMGKIVYFQSLQASNTTLNLGHLSSGFYMIAIRSHIETYRKPLILNK